MAAAQTIASMLMPPSSPRLCRRRRTEQGTCDTASDLAPGEERAQVGLFESRSHPASLMEAARAREIRAPPHDPASAGPPGGSPLSRRGPSTHRNDIMHTSYPRILLHSLHPRIIGWYGTTGARVGSEGRIGGSVRGRTRTRRIRVWERGVGEKREGEDSSRDTLDASLES